MVILSVFVRPFKVYTLLDNSADDKLLIFYPENRLSQFMHFA